MKTALEVIGNKEPFFVGDIVLLMEEYAAQFQQEWVDVINKRITDLEWYRINIPGDTISLSRANELRYLLTLLPSPPKEK